MICDRLPIFIVAIAIGACAPSRPTLSPGDNEHATLLPAIDAVDAILSAVDSAPIVAIADDHEIAQLGAFRLRLLNDPRLPLRVQDIVIEGGNSLYQRLADRFVEGAPVSDDSLRLIWNNTTQSPLNTLDVPMYAEDVLRTVRKVNASRTPAQRLRVLLADPPLDWSAITTRADLQGKLDRTASELRVLADSVLAHGRRAIFICGGVHLYKTTVMGRENQARRNLVQRLIAEHPGSVYVVLMYNGFGGTTAPFNRVFASLPRESIVSIAGTALADLPADQVFAATPETPAGAPAAVRLIGGAAADTGQLRNNFTDLRLGDVADAILFLRPYAELTLAPATLDHYRTNPALLVELDRRQMIRAGTHYDTTDFFAPRRSLFPFAAGRRDMRVPVPTSHDPRNEGIRAVGRAIAAVGGEGRLNTLRSVSRVGLRFMSDPGQGYKPVPVGELHPPVLETSTRAVVIDFRGGRSATTTTGTIFGGQPFSFRNVTSPQGSFAANDVKRTVQTAPGSSVVSSSLSRLPRAYPEVVLQQAWASRDSLRVIGGTDIGGRRHAIVATNGASFSPRLYIDEQTGLLSKQEVIARTPNGTDTISVAYDDWRNVDGLRLPFVQSDRRNGVRTERYAISSLAVNSALPESVFALPQRYSSTAPVAPLSPTLTKLADDLYLVERGYNSMFVVLDDYVMVIEPSLGGPASQAMQQLVTQVAPGKPIRYVVATHFHSDHTGGAAFFLRNGSTVVTTTHAAEAIRRSLARVESDSAKPAADSQFELVGARRTFSDARHEVHVYQIGPNPHAEQMLVVYFPKERLLFEGDMLDIDVPRGQVPIAGEDTRMLLQQLRRLGLEVATIVPVHGRVGTFADLESAVRAYRPARR